MFKGTSCSYCVCRGYLRRRGCFGERLDTVGTQAFLEHDVVPMMLCVRTPAGTDTKVYLWTTHLHNAVTATCPEGCKAGVCVYGAPTLELVIDSGCICLGYSLGEAKEVWSPFDVPSHALLPSDGESLPTVGNRSASASDTAAGAWSQLTASCCLGYSTHVFTYSAYRQGSVNVPIRTSSPATSLSSADHGREEAAAGRWLVTDASPKLAA